VRFPKELFPDPLVFFSLEFSLPFGRAFSNFDRGARRPNPAIDADFFFFLATVVRFFLGRLTASPLFFFFWAVDLTGTKLLPAHGLVGISLFARLNLVLAAEFSIHPVPL